MGSVLQEHGRNRLFHLHLQMDAAQCRPAHQRRQRAAVAIHVGPAIACVLRRVPQRVQEPLDLAMLGVDLAFNFGVDRGRRPRGRRWRDLARAGGCSVSSRAARAALASAYSYAIRSRWNPSASSSGWVTLSLRAQARRISRSSVVDGMPSTSQMLTPSLKGRSRPRGSRVPCRTARARARYFAGPGSRRLPANWSRQRAMNSRRSPSDCS